MFSNQPPLVFSFLLDLPIFDERFDVIPSKCKSEIPPKNCAEATACIQRCGIYYITLPAFSSDRYLVECDIKTEGGTWTLIQRRQDGSVDFLRNWSEYQNGFGSIYGEFFIGLNMLHALTHFDGPQELLIRLQDQNETRVAKYSNFAVGNESESYNLKHLGVYSGNAGDSLMYHLGVKFSTIDHDNDEDPGNCAATYTGAWWHKTCHVSNLNGKYGDNAFGKGLNWLTFRGYNVSIQHVTMMIRRRMF